MTVPGAHTRPLRKAASKPLHSAKKSASASTLNLVEAWRVESWLAAVMLAAGRTEDAAALAEAVCAAGVTPSPGTSLAMATPQTAFVKGHVRLDSASGPDEGLPERVLEIAAASGTAVALQYLQMQGASARSRATILAQLARAEPDAARAYSLWLDALIASRTAGRATLAAVVADGEEILARANTGETTASLQSQLAGIDSQLGG